MRSLRTRLNAYLPSILIVLFLNSIPALAQYTISAKAGSIQYLEGEVFLDGNSIQLRKERCFQIENEQILSTKKGCVELLLSPFAYLRLGENASLRMKQNKLTNIQLELNQGSAFIEVFKKLKTDPIRIYISNSIMEIKKDGLYRIDSDPGIIRVYGGEAHITNGDKRIRIKKEKMLILDGPLKTMKFDPCSADALQKWAAQRSFVLYVKSSILSKPLVSASDSFIWKARPEGLYNKYYCVTVPYNDDWYRLQQAVRDKYRKRREQDARFLKDLPNISPGRVEH
jgi:hypothetical protein